MKIYAAVVMAMLATVAAANGGDQTIEDAQRALKEQGFYYGEVNGRNNADTTAAIRRYQIRNGLEVTGELNDETLRSIRANSSEPQSASPSAPASAPPPEPRPVAPTDDSDLRSDNSDDQTPPTKFSARPRNPIQLDPNQGSVVPPQAGLFAGTPYETASIKVQRRVIADAQRLLAARGWFKGRIDGAYGPDLEFSLRAYQARVGLRATGRLDLETLAALELLPGAHTPFIAPRRPIGPALPPVRGEWVRP